MCNIRCSVLFLSPLASLPLTNTLPHPHHRSPHNSAAVQPLPAPTTPTPMAAPPRGACVLPAAPPHETRSCVRGPVPTPAPQLAWWTRCGWRCGSALRRTPSTSTSTGRVQSALVMATAVAVVVSCLRPYGATCQARRWKLRALTAPWLAHPHRASWCTWCFLGQRTDTPPRTS